MTSQSSPSKRRRGGQPGNTNAIKHGLYSRCLNPSHLYRLGVNSGYTTDQQIAQLRLYIRDLFDYAAQVDDLSENLALLHNLTIASGVLARFVRRRSQLPVGPISLQSAISRALVRQMLKEKETPGDASPPAPPRPGSDSN